jgi:hypothetical protein
VLARMEKWGAWWFPWAASGWEDKVLGMDGMVSAQGLWLRPQKRTHRMVNSTLCVFYCNLKKIFLNT